MISRRTFLRFSLGTGVSALGVGVYTWKVEPHWLEIVRRPLAIAGLPSTWVGKSLVQLSDLHAGPRVADDYLLDTFEKVRALAPDLIVYTGDFTDYEPGILARVARIYADPPRGRLATLGILGNHDYGPNWSHPEIAARIADLLRASGIRILRNEVAEVAGLQVVGLDDLWADRFEPWRALASLEPGRGSIVLSHNPDTVDRPVWNGYEGWILAGHTHGGQCKPPFLPPPLLPVKNRRYTAGEFELSGGRRLYISRGVGHLLEVRFNVRPEVTVFELQAA